VKEMLPKKGQPSRSGGQAEGGTFEEAGRKLLQKFYLRKKKRPRGSSGGRRWKVLVNRVPWIPQKKWSPCERTVDFHYHREDRLGNA